MGGAAYPTSIGPKWGAMTEAFSCLHQSPPSMLRRSSLKVTIQINGLGWARHTLPAITKGIFDVQLEVVGVVKVRAAYVCGKPNIPAFAKAFFHRGLKPIGKATSRVSTTGQAIE